MYRNQLLQLAIPLVKTYGFSREALARSVLYLPKPHEQPLSDAAVNSLFGTGDDARKTLITGWLDHAREEMRTASTPGTSVSLKEVLAQRLKANEPVLPLLPEVSETISPYCTHVVNMSNLGLRSPCIPHIWASTPGPYAWSEARLKGSRRCVLHHW